MALNDILLDCDDQLVPSRILEVGICDICTLKIKHIKLSSIFIGGTKVTNSVQVLIILTKKDTSGTTL